MISFPEYLWKVITKELRPWLAYTAGPVIWLLCIILMLYMFILAGALIAMPMFWEFLRDRFVVIDRISTKVSNLKYLFIKRSE